MERTDNYKIQAAQAKSRFLTYDQEKLIAKLGLKSDESWLYTALFGQSYRICRKTGDLEKWEADAWRDANTFEEVLTLMDLVCDSREDRFVSGKWKNMGAFGLMFHQNLLEGKKDPLAEKFQENAEGFCRACLALGGKPFPKGDAAFAFEVFDGLPLVVQLWFGDEEFPASLRFLWDENAKMYIKYETMYYARGILLEKIEGLMDG